MGGGGPQAGLLVGRTEAIATLGRHPLMRALRLDKMTLAALEGTLRIHAGSDAAAVLPVLRMLAQSIPELDDRARRLCALLGGVARVEPSCGYAGGGTLPTDTLPSRAAVVPGPGLDDLARRLRLNRPAVVGRISAGELWLDMLAVADSDLADIAAAVRAALG